MDLAKFPLDFCTGPLDRVLVGLRLCGSEMWIVDLAKSPLGSVAGPREAA